MRRGCRSFVVTAAVAMVLVVPAVARASTITVNTTDDVLINGVCSLRAAVIAANSDTAVDGCPAGSGADTIVVPAGTYDLGMPPTGLDGATSGDYNLTSPVTIEGAGSGMTIIDGRFDGMGAPLDRLFHITGGGAYVINGITLQDGAAGSGGAVAIDDGSGAAVTLENSTITASNSSAAANLGTGGGAIFNAATLTVTGSTITSNTSVGNGGGIMNLGTLTVTSSTISQNTAGVAGGGIRTPGDLTLRRSTVSSNTAGDGGGVETDGETSTVVIDHSMISNNTAAINSSEGDGGGLNLNGPAGVQVTATTITGNHAAGRGGGVYMQASATISTSVIANNTSPSGGGVFTFADLALTNSTVTGNGTPTTQGGGIYDNSSGVLTLLNDTLAVNHSASGGGDELFNNAGSGTTQDTIFYGDDQCEGTPLVSDGNNLINVVATNCWSNSDPTSIAVADPMLGQLKNNGGPTQTMSLLAGSPAVDAGANCAPADQRGAPRPNSTLESGETAGTACDIGAYERAKCLGVLVNRVGSAGADTINGTSKADGILALGGNDTINPGGGADGICAGKGNDTVTLADGFADKADGGPGTDTVTNHDPTDTLTNFEIVH